MVMTATARRLSVWRSGSQTPDNSVGIDGDFYLDTTTGDISERVSGIYVFQFNVKGTAGAAGTIWRSGSGAPSNGVGIDGDYYFNTATADVYKRAAGAYSIVANFANGILVWNGTDYVPIVAKALTSPKEFRGPTDPHTVSGVVLNQYDVWIQTA